MLMTSAGSWTSLGQVSTAGTRYSASLAMLFTLHLRSLVANGSSQELQLKACVRSCTLTRIRILTNSSLVAGSAPLA